LALSKRTKYGALMLFFLCFLGIAIGEKISITQLIRIYFFFLICASKDHELLTLFCDGNIFMVFKMTFSNIKSFANSFIGAKEGLIEYFSENNRSIITNLIVLLNANYVFGTCLMKNLPSKLRMTAGHKNKLRLTALRFYHTFKLLI
jgi:hypothetical protein